METEGGRRLPRVVIGVGGALLLGWDADRDIAVLAICCAADFVAIPLGAVHAGAGLDVVAVGYPPRRHAGPRPELTAIVGAPTIFVVKDGGFFGHPAV